MWNLISGLKTLRENSVQIFLLAIWSLDVLKRIVKIFPKRLLNKEIKKAGLKFNSGLELIGLWTTRPSTVARVLSKQLFYLHCKCVFIYFHKTKNQLKTHAFIMATKLISKTKQKKKNCYIEIYLKNRYRLKITDQFLEVRLVRISLVFFS